MSDVKGMLDSLVDKLTKTTELDSWLSAQSISTLQKFYIKLGNLSQALDCSDNYVGYTGFFDQIRHRLNTSMKARDDYDFDNSAAYYMRVAGNKISKGTGSLFRSCWSVFSDSNEEQLSMPKFTELDRAINDLRDSISYFSIEPLREIVIESISEETGAITREVIPVTQLSQLTQRRPVGSEASHVLSSSQTSILGGLVSPSVLTTSTPEVFVEAVKNEEQLSTPVLEKSIDDALESNSMRSVASAEESVSIEDESESESQLFEPTDSRLLEDIQAQHSAPQSDFFASFKQQAVFSKAFASSEDPGSKIKLN